MLALAAAFLARALSPALPGSATGIAELIAVTGFVAACASQLAVAGGIALCLRSLSSVLAAPRLDPLFRLVVVPVALGVSALALGSAAGPLAGDPARMLAFAATGLLLTAVPWLWRTPGMRSYGIFVLLAALGSITELVAIELGRFGVVRPLSPILRLIDGAALVLEASALLVAVAATARSWRRFADPAWLSLLALGAALWVRAAQDPNDGVLGVVLRRAISAFAKRPLAFVPNELGAAISTLAIASGVLLLTRRGMPSSFRAAGALSVLGTLGVGVPMAALSSVAGLLLAVSEAGRLRRSAPGENRERPEQDGQVRHGGEEYAPGPALVAHAAEARDQK